MNKNWLIRTKNNHILGPVSKEKIRDLISNGSIKGDDEICSGDGYWIYVRETELVSKYILGEEKQGFNPVQEAKTILATGISSSEESTSDDLFPSNDDLDYPDMGEGPIEDALLPETEDLEYPGNNIIDNKPSSKGAGVRSSDSSNDVVSMRKKKTPKKIGESDSKTVPTPRISKKPKLKESKNPVISKTFFSMKLIYICVFIFFIIAVSSFYFRKTIFSEFMDKVSSIVVTPVYAQTTVQVKKKSGLTIQA
jgi:hypothetical protein